MTKILSLFYCLITIGCSSLTIPESNIDPNNPNHPPILVSHGEIEYPKLAQKTDVVGKIEVELTIDTVGSVAEVKIINRQFNVHAIERTNGQIVYIKDLFDAPIIKFYKECKYLPGLKEGIPVIYKVQTGMGFSLR